MVPVLGALLILPCYCMSTVCYHRCNNKSVQLHTCTVVLCTVIFLVPCYYGIIGFCRFYCQIPYVTVTSASTFLHVQNCVRIGTVAKPVVICQKLFRVSSLSQKLI